MSKRKDLKSFEQDTESVIENTLKELVSGLTGVATSSKNDLILSLSHTFQKMRGGQLLAVLSDEWDRYKEKGKVKDDYQFTEQHKVCLQELLEFLDKDSPDEVRFSILKQIFLVAASEEVSDRESILPQQFMKIARSLSDGEVMLLTAIWKISNEHKGEYDQNYSAAQWIDEVTVVSGMKYKELVEIHEQELIDKRLLTPRRHGDNSGITVRPNYRLTDLGCDLCHFIGKYEE